MEVRLIERPVDIDEMWPKALAWKLENLAGIDVNLPKDTNLTVTAVRDVLPTLERLNYTVFMRSSGEKMVGAIVINHKGFVFGRGQEVKQLQLAEAKAKEAETVVGQYSKVLETAKAQADDLKRRMREGVVGVDLAAVKAQVEAWPEVIDFSYGPGVDRVTEQYLDSGTFVVTMLPVIFSGQDRGYNDGFMATTPIRFFVTEGGAVSAYGNEEKRTSTHHPHIQAGGLCHGNMLDALRGPIAENNLIAAVDIMREWRIANAGHDLDPHWTTKAYNWWQYWMSKPRNEDVTRRDNPNHAWHFDGRWDGTTVQVSSTKKQIVTLEDFYGADMDSIIHVMSVLSTNYRAYPPIITVQAYAKTDPNVKGTCNWCQGERTGCACHGEVCRPCNRTPATCACPVKLDKAVVVEFVNNNIAYYNTMYHPDHRHRAGREGGGYRCEVIDEKGVGCMVRSYAKTVWRRTAARAPRFVCQDHLNKAALATYEARLKEAQAAFEKGQVTQA